MATTSNPFTDFSKMLEQFKLPGVDMTSVIEARRKDIDALTEANKVAYQGMQALVQKQTEILSKTMQEIQAAAQQMGTGGSPAEAMAKQGEFVQQGLQKAFNNMRELAEMAQKSQAEALAVITKRAEQNIEDAKNLMKGKGGK
ncbi:MULTISPECIES: phasin family protein [Cupriavidus]